MKVLILNKHSHITGVTTFTYTLAKGLVDAGHNVTVIFGSYDDSDVIGRFSMAGIKTIISVVGNLPDEIDIIFVNHESMTRLAVGYKCKKVFIAHGIMDSDYFPSHHIYDNIYTLSERAYDTMARIYGSSKVLMIRNYIDINRFNYIPYHRARKAILVVNANIWAEVIAKIILPVAAKFDLFVGYAGIDSHGGIPGWDIENKIREADIVIGYGRSIYEAMSMGKSVIVFGEHGGDGFISSPKLFDEMLITNCSGYSIRSMPPLYVDRKDLFDAMVKEVDTLLCSDPHNIGIMMRALIEENLNINKFVNNLTV